MRIKRIIIIIIIIIKRSKNTGIIYKLCSLVFTNVKSVHLSPFLGGYVSFFNSQVINMSLLK